jgi:hypothetical protein
MKEFRATCYPDGVPKGKPIWEEFRSWCERHASAEDFRALNEEAQQYFRAWVKEVCEEWLAEEIASGKISTRLEPKPDGMFDTVCVPRGARGRETN